MDENTIEIPDAVFADFERVRSSGFVNMFRRPDVIYVARMLDCDALVDWHDQFDRRELRQAWPALLTGFSTWKAAQHADS